MKRVLTLFTTLLAGAMALAQAQDIDSRKVYYICTPDGLVLDSQESINPETKICLSSQDGRPSQAW